MKVSEIMTEDVACCTPRESLERAAQIMWEKDCGCVPVVDGFRRPVGMITDRDACMSAYLRGRRLAEVGLDEVMSREVHTCKAEDELTAAHGLMREHRIRRLPVVDEDGLLIGLVSLNDIIRCTAKPTSSAKSRPTTKDLVATLSQVSQPRWSLESKVVLPTPPRQHQESRPARTATRRGSKRKQV
jgi:CBS domain-containing protein